MLKTKSRLATQLARLTGQRVRYTGWNGDLDAFVERRLREPRPTKVKTLEWLAAEPQLGASFSLLDVGCGPGVFAQMLRRSPLCERVRYTGVDQSEVALAHAQKSLGSDYRFIQADVLNEGLPDGSFDVIVINEVVEHMPHYRQLIAAALEKQPQVLVVTTFAVLPEQGKDRVYWNARYSCYMNTYSFNTFHLFLRESGRPIQILDLGSEADETVEFPRKALILFYMAQPTAAA